MQSTNEIQGLPGTVCLKRVLLADPEKEATANLEMNIMRKLSGMPSIVTYYFGEVRAKGVRTMGM